MPSQAWLYLWHGGGPWSLWGDGAQRSRPLGRSCRTKASCSSRHCYGLRQGFWLFCFFTSASPAWSPARERRGGLQRRCSPLQEAKTGMFSSPTGQVCAGPCVKALSTPILPVRIKAAVAHTVHQEALQSQVPSSGPEVRPQGPRRRCFSVWLKTQAPSRRVGQTSGDSALLCVSDIPALHTALGEEGPCPSPQSSFLLRL